MTTSKLDEQFLRNWSQEFRKHRLASNTASVSEFDFWEGNMVCEELARAGVLDSLAVVKSSGQSPAHLDWKQKLVFAEISRFVQTYRKLESRVLRINKEFKAVTEFLTRIQGHFSKRLTTLHFEGPKKLLARYPRMFKTDLQRAPKVRGMAWQSGLESVADAFDLKFRAVPVREGDLDAIFQIKLGGIFRGYLRREKISIPTIAGLVVLTYVSAELAKDREDYLIISHSGRKLIVADVEQRLRRAALHRISSIRL